MKAFEIILPLLPEGEKYLSAKNSELMLFKSCEKSHFVNITGALLKSGADCVFKNTVDGNEFAFFCFEGENVSVGFFYGEREIRVIAETGYLFPDFKKTEAKGECVPTLFQFETNHSLIDCGMCYILKNRDGSFALIDSGHQYSVNDSERIHAFLRERTEENEKIRIAGWLFTHGHDDHIVQFTEYLKRFSDDTVIDGLYYNFVSCRHPDSVFWDSELEKYCNEFYDEIARHPEIPVYRVHTGMEFFIGSFKVTALCLHEDVFPNSIKDYNDSSLVTVFSGGGNKIMFPGDAAVEESKILEKRYGDFLKCDIVQCSHHGHVGTSSAFYRAVGARLALVPNTKIKYDEEYVKIEADRVMESIADEVYLSSDGTVEVPLPYDKSTVKVYDDETFEVFDAINKLWGYSYTDDFKAELYRRYLERGGTPIEKYERAD